MICLCPHYNTQLHVPHVIQCVCSVYRNVWWRGCPNNPLPLEIDPTILKRRGAKDDWGDWNWDRIFANFYHFCQGFVESYAFDAKGAHVSGVQCASFNYCLCCVVVFGHDSPSCWRAAFISAAAVGLDADVWPLCCVVVAVIVTVELIVLNKYYCWEP